MIYQVDCSLKGDITSQVYFLPTITDEYKPSDVPKHPMLKLIANSPEHFSKWTRRLITMEKLSEPELSLNKESALEALVPAGHHMFRDKYFAYKSGTFT